MKRAYSYIRFSSPPQEWGASEKRQDEKAQEWCSGHGVTLADKFADRGVSAWKGKNREGALGELVKILQPGDFLLVEDEDRISRENPLKFGNYLFEIAQRGISIVTLTDGKIITGANFFESNVFLPMILKSTLAHMEDEKKSERILDAWERRRQTIIQKKDAFGKLPYWLKRDRNTGRMHEVPEAVKVVKLIFKLCDEGMGIRGITEYLLRSKTPTFRTAKGQPTKWSSSTVQYTLRTPAVYGAFQNHRKIGGKRRPLGDLIENVLPVILPKDYVLLVQDKISKRKQFAVRGVIKANNLFSRIAVCQHCGGSMTYTQKGKHGYLTCSAFHSSHACRPGVLNYAIIERTMFRFMIWNLNDYKVLLNKNGTTEIDNEINTLKVRLIELKKKSEAAVNKMLEFPDSEELTAAFRTLTKQQKDLGAKLSALEAEHRQQTKLPSEWAGLAKTIKSGEFDRRRMREQFRSIIRKLVCNVQANRFTVNWVSTRPPDTIEVKQTFHGCKPAVWAYRFKLGVAGARFSPWNTL